MIFIAYHFVGIPGTNFWSDHQFSMEAQDVA